MRAVLDFLNSIKEGKIIDSGKVSFVVKRAHIWECYFYEPELFLYLRLLEEKDPAKEKTWISMDFDLIKNSAWFVETFSDVLRIETE